MNLFRKKKTLIAGCIIFIFLCVLSIYLNIKEYESYEKRVDNMKCTPFSRHRKKNLC